MFLQTVSISNSLGVSHNYMANVMNCTPDTPRSYSCPPLYTFTKVLVTNTFVTNKLLKWQGSGQKKEQNTMLWTITKATTYSNTHNIIEALDPSFFHSHNLLSWS
jgi:hypothetical protein